MPLSRIIKILISISLFVALIVWVQPSRIIAQVINLDLRFVAGMMIYRICAFGVRSVKWQLMMQSGNVDISLRDIIKVLNTAQLFSNFFPGKLSEPLAVVLFRQQTGAKYSKLSFYLFTERFLQGVIIVMWGVFTIVILKSEYVNLVDPIFDLFGGYAYVVYAVCAILLIISIVLLKKNTKNGFFSNQVLSIIHYRLVGKLVLLSILFWVFLFAARYFIIKSFDFHLSFFVVSHICALSVFAGIISLIPGTREITSVGILKLFGIPFDMAVSIMIVSIGIAIMMQMIAYGILKIKR